MTSNRLFFGLFVATLSLMPIARAQTQTLGKAIGQISVPLSVQRCVCTEPDIEAGESREWRLSAEPKFVSKDGCIGYSYWYEKPEGKYKFGECHKPNGQCVPREPDSRSGFSEGFVLVQNFCKAATEDTCDNTCEWQNFSARSGHQRPVADDMIIYTAPQLKK